MSESEEISSNQEVEEEVEEEVDQAPVEVPLHFKCPISMTILKDPITVPCCGRVYSRNSLEVIFQNRKTCPICQVDLRNFDLESAPKAVTLQDAIDAFIADNDGNIEDLVVDKSKIQKPSWTSELTLVPNTGVNLREIAQLRILNQNKNFSFKTLLMTVVDESGSMNGNPIAQVKFSLERIIDSAYNNQNVLCQMIGYDTTAQSFFVDTSQPKETNYARVKKIGRSGGTSFQCAFDMITKIMDNMKDSPVNNLNDVSDLVIIFMTDGQDCTSGNERMMMVSKLSDSIKKIWTKPFTVHTVGFGSGHDFNFLQNLAKAGTLEGAYRFADPSENNDSLSIKIASIIRSVMGGGSAPVELHPYKNPNDTDEYIENLDYKSLPVLGGANGTYWIDVTDAVRASADERSRQRYLYTVKLNGVPDQVIDITHHFAPDEHVSAEDSNVAGLVGEKTDDANGSKQIEYAWYSYQMDKIAAELYELNAQSSSITKGTPTPLDRQFHLELLNNRTKALSHRMSANSPEYGRLSGLIDTLNVLRKGDAVDKMKLADQMAEGRFKTEGGSKIDQIPRNSSVPQYTPSNYNPTHYSNNYYHWDTLNTEVIPRVNLNTGYRDDIIPFLQSSFSVCKEIIKSMSSDYIKRVRDGSGANLLIMMCSTGRMKIVKLLVESCYFTGLETDNNGDTALDKCVLFGFWKSYDLVRNLVTTFRLTYDKYVLFRTCISKKYYKTASRLIKENIIVIDDDMINSSPTHSTQWLVARSNLDIDIETAIIKGAYDIVEDKIEKGGLNRLDWKSFDKVLSKPKIEHVQIFELLLRNKLLDPDQTYEITNPTIDRKDGDDLTEITWPLFVACENGNMSLFNLLMNYVSKESINRQNKKGSYCLWIASCNKHVDIVSKLLSEGADPNMVNAKGENCIVPACQKSAVSVCELLLVAGARLDLYNKERDNPFLLCCRIGQHVILEMFLQRLSAEELDDIHNQYAEIDGFNPLHASVEQNRTECIKVCQRYRANLEWRTKEDNQIIPGATALHLACFYNQIDSLKLLIELGADVLATTSVGGYNCMHVAIRRGHMRIVGYLMTLQPKIRDSLLQQRDFDDRLPGYYAQISGNEEIYQEYFCNRIASYMEKLLYAPDDVVKACSEKLIKYGETPGVYEYKDYIDSDVGRGSTIMTYAIINRSDVLAETLERIGARSDVADDYGVTSNFWKAFIQNTHASQLDLNTKEMMNRIETTKARSLQNKMLLSIPSKAPLALDSRSNTLISSVASSALTPFIKMNDGFNKNVDNSVIKLLQRSGFIEQSLLGFMDKLKSGKNFPDGKDCLEYILWDSKLHLIRLIATDEKYLDPVQILALYLYSSNKTIFEQVNLTLMRWENSQSSVWHPYVLTIYQALSKLPAFDGEVYRVVDWKFDPDFYKIGATLTWSTFSICSKEYSSCVDAIKRDTGVVFIVKSKTGRDIGRYSKTPVDQDVIFAPGTKFSVTNYYQPNQITLSQANIRNITFKIREKDIQNAIEGRCIIIELQEL